MIAETASPNTSRAASACLALLLLVAPFEPRFTFPLGLLRVSLVEVVALLSFPVLWFGSRGRYSRGPMAPSLLALLLMFVVSLFSASLAEPDPGRALKFALRLGAMTAFAVLVARLDERQWRWGVRALALSGSCAAILAILEGLGVRSLDVALGAFRETPFNVAGVRRATAGSEYPNLGAGMIVYALLAGVTLLRGHSWMRAAFVLTATFGLAFTYSRGAWLAGALGLALLLAFEQGRARFIPASLYLFALGLFVGREEISQIRFSGENANDFYAAVYEAPAELSMDSSAFTMVRVTVHNVGRRPWRRADQIHLSYHLYQDSTRPLIDGPRTDLPRDVLAGESVTIEASLRAPRRPGQYLLMWDLVHEDTTWFSGQGVRPAVARLTVGAASIEGSGASAAQAIQAIPERLAWRPSRLDLWRIALRMWAENPFFGVGPDNFRWTYGAVVGRTTFDTRVFANNMFLEFAATLGGLGLAAFGAGLAFSLASGLRAAPRSQASLIALGILVAMTVHGVLDYLLAFTGHYLVFGFAAGVVSRGRLLERPDVAQAPAAD